MTLTTADGHGSSFVGKKEWLVVLSDGHNNERRYYSRAWGYGDALGQATIEWLEEFPEVSQPTVVTVEER